MISGPSLSETVEFRPTYTPQRNRNIASARALHSCPIAASCPCAPKPLCRTSCCRLPRECPCEQPQSTTATRTIGVPSLSDRRPPVLPPTPAIAAPQRRRTCPLCCWGLLPSCTPAKGAQPTSTAACTSSCYLRETIVRNYHAATARALCLLALPARLAPSSLPLLPCLPANR